MNKDANNIKGYYDEFTSHQKNMGVHVRHRTILKNLKKEGLKPNSNVLEIGCGIGTVTQLIAKYCKNGKVVAADISPKSIEIAKKLNNQFNNIEFIVNDMLEFKHQIIFDFVVLPDVLEHIPIEQHLNLFKKIKEHTHEGSTVLINIPSPAYLRWVHKNHPEQLQIIDQPIDTNILVENVYPNDFWIQSLNTYALSIKEGDYQTIVLKRNSELKNATPLSTLKKAYLKRVSKFY